ncbi:acetate/propionate family kinase [Mesorhizobium sp. MSK_1335]|uniref:Acetate kinase n=1 Tax=Mesorhizobium montanum TaxID=3072323 RepID=A0ABU4ZUU4_9HYPH|nr:acetate/propionate family kinase [Mesorhizobium sp. MSK_1335]MDX8529178.1 acetate/propionate family kinase [Mesorhizobium sp. MSK_1335]
MTDAILTLNAGSSSLKFALFAIEGASPLLALRGEIEEIDTAPRLTAKDATGSALVDQSWPESAGDFQSLFAKVIGWIEDHADNYRVVAVGHRVVHGGPDHVGPERVTPDLLTVLDSLTPLAPLHEPQNIAPIRAIAKLRPDLPQVVCFDTAFHHTMPVVARRLGLPREYEAAGVRRYGFHGLSYEYISRRLSETAPDLTRGRVIVAHLGNGASLCALHKNESIDTTMGFSALDGLMMGTRPGNLDPGVILHLLQQRGMAVAELEDLLYRRSGLRGVSGGIASDMRALLASTDIHAAEAVELFCYRIAREAGALVSSLGGLDGLIFTAGIGEHAPRVRELVCRRLAWLGVELDRDANARNAEKICTTASRVEVRVIATDEEAMIARHTLETI